MQMHLVIALLFSITVFLSLIEDYLQEKRKLQVVALYVIVMVSLAATKSIDHVADAATYEDMFLRNDDIIFETITEPTFIYLSRLIIALGGSIGTLFFIYALITIPAKLRAMTLLTPFVFTALVVYIPIYFEVHDMIQIRAAAAATFLMVSLIFIVNKRYLIAGLLMVCGILFHYSAVAYLPFLFVGNMRLSRYGRIAVAALLPICFLIYLSYNGLLSLLAMLPLGGKLEFYRAATEEGQYEQLSPLYFNLYFWAKCVMLGLCLYYYDYIVSQNRYAPILINLFASSLLFILLMAAIPVVASRISDLYGIIDGVVFSFALYLIRPRYVARIGIALAALFMLVYNMVNTEYFF